MRLNALVLALGAAALAASLSAAPDADARRQASVQRLDAALSAPAPETQGWLTPLASPNPMHPPFAVLDEHGRLVKDSGRPASSALSCAVCHDTAFIRSHDSHAQAGVAVDCLACHTPSGKLPQSKAAYDDDGRLKRAWIALQRPTAQQCLACHGAGTVEDKPWALSPGLMATRTDGLRHPQHFTRQGGSVFSAQPMAASLLNLEGKEGLHQPWDVHAARLLSCADCHAPLDRSLAFRQNGLLCRDPREQDTAAHLQRPEHRLQAVDCQSCHAPELGHAFLPYAQRHFDRLACQACHVPSIHAPVLMEEDRSVPGPDGGPRTVWRNLGGDDSQPLNSRPVRRLEPALLMLAENGQAPKLRPANVVTERRWVDAADGRDVDWALVQRAWAPLQRQAGAPVSAQELLQVGAALKKLGVARPEIRSLARAIPLDHGVRADASVLRRCSECHAPGSRVERDLPLEAGVSAGPQPTLVDSAGRTLSAAVGSIQAGPGGSSLHPGNGVLALELPGLADRSLSTRLGFGAFVLAVLGVLGHGFFRWRAWKRRGSPRTAPGKKVYLYSAYERLWHWVMAASTLALLLTGLEIHFTAKLRLLGFAHAVSFHNVLALVLMVNAFLSLFYHVATQHISQFIPQGATMAGDIRRQLKFYLSGIFTGAAHPIPKAEGQKLNPLQQLTYLMLLNVLLPFQALTGIALWALGRWPGLAGQGALGTLLPLHNLGSWLFLAFTVGHVYLTSTGHTLSSNLRAMVDGWDELDEHPPKKEPRP